MGVQLYGREPVFTSTMDGFFAEYGPALREEWLTASPRLPIGAAERGQPLLFALDYAIAATITAWGCRPAALVGHSVREFAATAPDPALLHADRPAAHRGRGGGSGVLGRSADHAGALRGRPRPVARRRRLPARRGGTRPGADHGGPPTSGGTGRAQRRGQRTV